MHKHARIDPTRIALPHPGSGPDPLPRQTMHRHYREMTLRPEAYGAYLHEAHGFIEGDGLGTPAHPHPGSWVRRGAHVPRVGAGPLTSRSAYTGFQRPLHVYTKPTVQA
jgi:hypothetical protein